MTIHYDPAKPWWRRRWYVPINGVGVTRGFTRRGTLRMADRARRWSQR